MQYSKRLWVSPVIRLVHEIYGPLLRALPEKVDGLIETVDLKDNNGKDVIGVKIETTENKNTIILHARDADSGRMLVQFKMYTEGKEVAPVAAEGQTVGDTMYLSDHYGVSVFLHRIVNFLIHSTMPSISDGQEE